MQAIRCLVSTRRREDARDSRVHFPHPNRYELCLFSRESIDFSRSFSYFFSFFFFCSYYFFFTPSNYRNEINEFGRLGDRIIRTSPGLRHAFLITIIRHRSFLSFSAGRKEPVLFRRAEGHLSRFFFQSRSALTACARPNAYKSRSRRWTTVVLRLFYYRFMAESNEKPMHSKKRFRTKIYDDFSLSVIWLYNYLLLSRATVSFS